MWTEHLSRLNDTTIKLGLHLDHSAMSFQQVLTAWEQEPDFCGFFVRILAGLPFTAYFWEMPPLLTSTLGQDFECVFVDSPALIGIHPEPEVFQQHYLKACEGVASFENLGRDAMLVAPVSHAEAAYSHLAEFCRCAPLHQQLIMRPSSHL